MKKTPAFLVLCFLSISAMVFAEDTIHTVKGGETVYALAKKYGVKVEQILFLNGIEDPRRIQSGQTLRIPSSGSVSQNTAAPIYKEHITQKNETLFGIARFYDIPVGTLRSINNLSETYKLMEGDRLNIPVAAFQNVAPAVPSTPVVKANPVPAKTPPTSTSTPATRVKTTPNPVQTPQTSVREFNWNIEWPIAVKEAAYMTGKLDGVVLTGEKSEPVVNLVSGTVVSAQPYRGFSKVIIVKTTGDYLYVYGGCENISVKMGDKIAAGTELGKLGVDSVSGKPQLFFMVYRKQTPIDPAKAPRE